jgi:hypothetical protein
MSRGCGSARGSHSRVESECSPLLKPVKACAASKSSIDSVLGALLVLSIPVGLMTWSKSMALYLVLSAGLCGPPSGSSALFGTVGHSEYGGTGVLFVTGGGLWLWVSIAPLCLRSRLVGMGGGGRMADEVARRRRSFAHCSKCHGLQSSCPYNCARNTTALSSL